MKKVGCSAKDQIRIKGKCVTILKGKSYGMKPSEFDQKQLKIGARVEMEHTTINSVAPVSYTHLTLPTILLV